MSPILQALVTDPVLTTSIRTSGTWIAVTPKNTIAVAGLSSVRSLVGPTMLPLDQSSATSSIGLQPLSL